MAWLNSGINFTLPGNGGPECMDYHSTEQKLLQTGLASVASLFCLFVGRRYHTPPSRLLKYTRASDAYHLLLNLVCLAMLIVYSLEIGYKFKTLQAVFSINPCHCICLIQLFLIKAENLVDCRTATYVFRIHLFFMHGPFMAVIFPVTNTLFLPGEVAVYWLEHFFLLLIPILLLKTLTVPQYTAKEMTAWAMMAYGVWGLFHFWFLLPIALWTQANLNSVLCPAISDPFRGQNYLLHAIWHQFAATLMFGLIFCFPGKQEAEFEPEVDKLR